MTLDFEVGFTTEPSLSRRFLECDGRLKLWRTSSLAELSDEIGFDLERYEGDEEFAESLGYKNYRELTQAYQEARRFYGLSPQHDGPAEYVARKEHD